MKFKKLDEDLSYRQKMDFFDKVEAAVKKGIQNNVALKDLKVDSKEGMLVAQAVLNHPSEVDFAKYVNESKIKTTLAKSMGLKYVKIQKYKTNDNSLVLSIEANPGNISDKSGEQQAEETTKKSDKEQST